MRYVTVGTVKKSIVAMSLKWFLMNVFQVWGPGRDPRIRYFLIVNSDTWIPSRASSFRIRGTPHVGLSRDIHLMSSLISGSILGRPSFFDFEFHRQ